MPILRLATQRNLRGLTFPWVYLNRRHDRPVSRGWSWCGTRHRAALGITEQTDAIVVVVSEENSQVSLVQRARIVRNRPASGSSSATSPKVAPVAPYQSIVSSESASQSTSESRTMAMRFMEPLRWPPTAKRRGSAALPIAAVGDGLLDPVVAGDERGVRAPHRLGAGPGGAPLGREPGVLGCDSVQNAVYGDRMIWVWGDTTLARIINRLRTLIADKEEAA